MGVLFKLIGLSMILLSCYANSLTFESRILHDNSGPNYLQFSDTNNSLSNSFEKVVADFNGDGIDDVLSLGGNINMIEGGFPVPIAPTPGAVMSMMLSGENGLLFHDLGIGYSSPVSVVVDIDQDGDLDIVLQSCQIALNDGNANFHLVGFSNLCSIPKQIHVVDVDADNDLDILTQDNFYINQGGLNFSKIDSVLDTTAQVFSFSDINKDNKPDLLQVINNELQSWINDGQGNFELLDSIELPLNVFLLHQMPLKTNEPQNLMLAFHGESEDFLKLLTNDGMGHFVINDFDLETEDFAINDFKIGKLYNKDADNNGTEDLWIASVYRNNDSCSLNNQNLLFLYKRQEGIWQKKVTIHSEGLQKDGFTLQNKYTVDSLPTIIDLNGDNFPDVVFTGIKQQAWLSGFISIADSQYFSLSNISQIQFNQTIDIADYNNDGFFDIFSSTNFSGVCESHEQQENFYTASHFVHSVMWMGDEQGGFGVFKPQFGGGNKIFRPYEYAVFADLEGDEEQNLLVTSPSIDGFARVSRYVYPRQVDPGLFYDLPEVTLNAKTAQLVSSCNKRQIVMIADTEEAPIIISRLAGSAGLVEVGRLNFGARNGEFKLADMDGDGSIDIVASTKGESDAITIWYNDGLMNFTATESFADSVISFTFLDVNNDGKLDIMTSNENHDIWLNQGQRSFVKHQYDDSFWFYRSGLHDLVNQIPAKLQTVDWNQDGKDDLLAYQNNSYDVYINNSTETEISFYRVFRSSAYVASGLENSAEIVNFNSDLKNDFIVFHDGKIKINTQIEEEVTTGLYFDSQYNGHGFSLDEIGRGNLYYSVFYTYDDEGNPEWFSALQRYVGYQNGFSLIQTNNSRSIYYSYNYDTNIAQVDNSTERRGRLSFNGNFLNTENISRAFFEIFDKPSVRWNIQEIIPFSQRSENDLSGHWWAGENDSGWGISLNFKEVNEIQTVVATLYFYDEEGQPVWVIGTQERFELNQDITIYMDKVNGYGRSQNSVELTRVPAGTITINLNQASQDVNQAGRLTMDIHYPNDSQNNNWVREAIPFGLLSKPRAP